MVTVNLTDALMQIANAIHRLAASHEAMAARGTQISDRLKKVMEQFGEDGSGHA